MKNLLVLLAFSLIGCRLSAQCPTDTTAPVLQLKTLPGIYPGANGVNCLSAFDLIDTVYDNCSGPGAIMVGMRHFDSLSCVYNGPQNLICFECCAQNTFNLIELWARDEAGNETRKQTVIHLLSDGTGFGCDLQSSIVITNALTETGKKIDTFDVRLFGNLNGGTPYLYQLGAKNGFAHENYFIPFTPYTIKPDKNNHHANGISSYDLLLISKHILGVSPLGSPYKIIAADANHSNTVTTFDITVLRKILLGINDTLQNNRSWRFVDSEFQFPNTLNPFQTSFPETISATVNNPIMRHSFIGVKIGDVNNSADPGAFTQEPDDRGLVELGIDNTTLRAGAEYEISLAAPGESGGVQALQFELAYDPAALEILSVRSDVLPGFDADHYNLVAPGRLRILWADARGQSAGKNLFKIRIKSLNNNRLSNILSIREDAFPAEFVGSQNGISRPVLYFSGSENEATDDMLRIFPNPVQNKLFVHIPAQSDCSNLRFSILDGNGKLLSSRQIPNAGPLEIPDVENLDSGLYFWQAHNSSFSRSGYFVKL